MKKLYIAHNHQLLTTMSTPSPNQKPALKFPRSIMLNRANEVVYKTGKRSNEYAGKRTKGLTRNTHDVLGGRIGTLNDGLVKMNYCTLIFYRTRLWKRFKKEFLGVEIDD